MGIWHCLQRRRGFVVAAAHVSMCSRPVNTQRRSSVCITGGSAGRNEVLLPKYVLSFGSFTPTLYKVFSCKNGCH